MGDTNEGERTLHKARKGRETPKRTKFARRNTRNRGKRRCTSNKVRKEDREGKRSGKVTTNTESGSRKREGES